jgi:hypothetical protein
LIASPTLAEKLRPICSKFHRHSNRDLAVEHLGLCPKAPSAEMKF